MKLFQLFASSALVAILAAGLGAELSPSDLVAPTITVEQLDAPDLAVAEVQAAAYALLDEGELRSAVLPTPSSAQFTAIPADAWEVVAFADDISAITPTRSPIYAGYVGQIKSRSAQPHSATSSLNWVAPVAEPEILRRI